MWNCRRDRWQGAVAGRGMGVIKMGGVWVVRDNGKLIYGTTEGKETREARVQTRGTRDRAGMVGGIRATRGQVAGRGSIGGGGGAQGGRSWESGGRWHDQGGGRRCGGRVGLRVRR